MMADTWITDVRHFLDESGDLPALSGPALGLALFLGSIVAWMTRGTVGDAERTNVNCRRRPGGRRCIGEIAARFDSLDEAIAWQCPRCGDRGIISGWQGSPWDRRRNREFRGDARRRHPPD